MRTAGFAHYREVEMKKSVLLLSGVSAIAFAYSANAEDLNPSVQSFFSTMNAAGGNETLQWQVAPTFSELFGIGIRTTVGGYVNEDFALGAIIDYSADREEYLANAGAQLNESMRIIGSVGLLKESEEFVLGDGRENVQQLEYGLSLKGNYEAGIVRGFEVNAYHTNASSGTDTVETGNLTGIQFVTQLKPSNTSDVRLGAGYERAEWDGGDVDQGFTLQAIGAQKLSDTLSLNYAGKSAETENTYGFGLTYDMSTADVQNSALSISFDQIEGKHGISDDTRVAINWTVGLGGAGASDVTVSSMGSMPSLSRKDLLADVMARPEFLPRRVLAHANGESEDTCTTPLIVDQYYAENGQPTGTFVYNYVTGYSYINLRFNSSSLPVDATVTIDGNTYLQHPITFDRGDGTTDVGFYANTFTTPYVDGQAYTVDYGDCSTTVNAWDYGAHATPP